MGKQFEDVSGRYGAPMGRQEFFEQPEGKVRLFVVNIDNGGYDDGGAYWGLQVDGYHIYCATDDKNFRVFVRARSREEAKRAVKRRVDGKGLEFRYYR